MTNLQKFLNFLSGPDYETEFISAKNSNSCVLCKESAKEFSTEGYKFEYSISALCERCQDTYIHKAYEQSYTNF